MNPPHRRGVAAEEANTPGGTALVTTIVARGHSTLTFECTDYERRVRTLCDCRDERRPSMKGMRLGRKKPDVVQETKPSRLSRKKPEVVQETKPSRLSRKKPEVVQETKPSRLSRKKPEVVQET